MTVYVDSLFDAKDRYHGKGEDQARRVGAKHANMCCHMVADQADCEELHAMAKKIGMRREWFQGDHYDLVPTRRVAAIANGAVEVDRRTFVEILRSQRRARTDVFERYLLRLPRGEARDNVRLSHRGLLPELHFDGCQFKKAATTRVAVACEHGYDTCPLCDPCTCPPIAPSSEFVALFEQMLNPMRSWRV